MGDGDDTDDDYGYDGDDDGDDDDYGEDDLARHHLDQGSLRPNLSDQRPVL